MSNISDNTVIFILTEKSPTSYQREDDKTFMDTPVEKRVIHEYSAIVDGKNEKFRHIRNEKSAMVSKQEKDAVFNPKRDNLFFVNGVMVLEVGKDDTSIEFMRNHPYSEDYDEKLRRDGIMPYFKESKPQAEGEVVVEDFIKESEAIALVMALQSKQDDGTYKYKEDKIDFLIRLFRLNSTLTYSEKIIELYKEAKKAPQDFIYAVNGGFSELEKNIESAINLGVIKTDKKTASMNSEILFVSDTNLNEKAMKDAIISHFISPNGITHLESLSKLIEEKQANIALKGDVKVIKA
jgi:hypothetical protein